MIQKYFLPILFLSAIAGAQTTQPVEIPTRISVKIENASLEDAVQEISMAAKIPLQLTNRRRGGMPINLPGGGNTGGPINITAENQPVLKVIQELIQQGKITPNYNDQSTPGTSFDFRMPVRVELIEDRMLLIINHVQMNGNTNIQGGESNYSYYYQGVILFDPAMKVVAVGGNARVNRLESGDATLRDVHFGGGEQLQRVDGRALAAHSLNIQFQTSKRLKDIASLSASVRTYQAVESVEAQITNTELLNGGKNEAEGLVLSAPPVDQNGVNIIIGGTVYTDLRNQYPWQQYLNTFLKIDGASGPVTGVYCNNMNQTNENVTLRLARRQGQLNADEIDTISFWLPRKLKQFNLPLTLNDMPIP